MVLANIGTHAANIAQGSSLAGFPELIADLSIYGLRKMLKNTSFGQGVDQSRLLSLLRKGTVKMIIGLAWYATGEWIGGDCAVDPVTGRPGYFAIGAYSTMGSIFSDGGDTVTSAIEGTMGTAESMEGLTDGADGYTDADIYDDEDDDIR